MERHTLLQAVIGTHDARARVAQGTHALYEAGISGRHWQAIQDARARTRPAWEAQWQETYTLDALNAQVASMQQETAADHVTRDVDIRLLPEATALGNGESTQSMHTTASTMEKTHVQPSCQDTLMSDPNLGLLRPC